MIADVSGKGVAAALLMPSIEVALRMDGRDSRVQMICYELSTMSFVRSLADTGSFPCSMVSSAPNHAPWNIQTQATIRRY